MAATMKYLEYQGQPGRGTPIPKIFFEFTKYTKHSENMTMGFKMDIILGLRSRVYLQDNPFITETLSAEKQVAWHADGTRERLARTSSGRWSDPIWVLADISTWRQQKFDKTQYLELANIGQTHFRSGQHQLFVQTNIWLCFLTQTPL